MDDMLYENPKEEAQFICEAFRDPDSIMLNCLLAKLKPIVGGK